MPVTRYYTDYAWLGGSGVDPRVLIEVDGERITAVVAGTERPADARHLSGVALPGLANAHSHAFHRALRGRTHRSWRHLLDLAGGHVRGPARIRPDSYHTLARATYAEMALAGISCVGEFHYLHHDPAGVPYADATVLATRRPARRRGLARRGGRPHGAPASAGHDLGAC